MIKAERKDQYSFEEALNVLGEAMEGKRALQRDDWLKMSDIRPRLTALMNTQYAWENIFFKSENKK